MLYCRNSVDGEVEVLDYRKGMDQARDLMDEYGLLDWALRGSTRFRRTLGRCIWKDKVILLSCEYVRLNTWRSVRETVLHEIAHALVPEDPGHGEAWKAKARELGIGDSSCASEPVSQLIRFPIICASCYKPLGQLTKRQPYLTVGLSKPCLCGSVTGILSEKLIITTSGKVRTV